MQPGTSTGGENYGWRCYEGDHEFNLTGCDTPASYTFPVYEFGHGPHCSVTGGYVYRGSMFPAMYGHYLFTDFCSSNFWSMSPDGGSGFNTVDHGAFSISGVSTFGENNMGELFVASLPDGTIYHVQELTLTIPVSHDVSITVMILLSMIIPVFLVKKGCGFFVAEMNRSI